jgi:argininosuccinate synthase
MKAPDTPYDISIHFDKGLPVKVVTPEKTVTESVELFNLLNALGKEHGIGRVVSIPHTTSLRVY